MTVALLLWWNTNFLVHKQEGDTRTLVSISAHERLLIHSNSGSVYITSSSTKHLVIINPKSINNFGGMFSYICRLILFRLLHTVPVIILNFEEVL